MSLICLCVVETIKMKLETEFYTQYLDMLAKQHKRGIKFCVDWSEPLLSSIQKDSFVVNVVDNPQADNCEMFLLPDGWYSNGNTNKVEFRERMKFLQELSGFFISRKHNVELYLGQSGTNLEDFFDVTLKINDLVDYLLKTVGVDGADDGVHISVVP